MKVTVVPEQIVRDGEAEMLTLTGRIGFTTWVIELEVAGFPEVQVRLEVTVQMTASLLLRAASVYVVEFVPAFTPFFFH